MSQLNPLRGHAVHCPPFPADTFWPVVDGSRVVPRQGIAQDRAFGAVRGVIPLRRSHAGVDLFADEGQTVCALTHGRVVAWYPFKQVWLDKLRRQSRTVWALVVDHGGFVAVYGELHADALASAGLRVDYVVAPGQRLGFVGKMKYSAMLHLETYTPGIRKNQRWKWGYPPPHALLDPTPALLELSQRRRDGFLASVGR